MALKRKKILNLIQANPCSNTEKEALKEVLTETRVEGRKTRVSMAMARIS